MTYSSVTLLLKEGEGHNCTIHMYVLRGGWYPITLTADIANSFIHIDKICIQTYVFKYLLENFYELAAVCPRSLDPINLLSYYIICIITSWTNSMK